MGAYSIGKLAKAAQVSVDTIRFYEKIGLLPKPARSPTGYRRYFGTDLRRLRFVRSARNLGLSLAEIGELVKLELERDESARAELKPRLATLSRRVTELQEWRRNLADWIHGAKLDTDDLAGEFRGLADSVVASYSLDPERCPGEPGGCRCAGALP